MMDRIIVDSKGPVVLVGGGETDDAALCDDLAGPVRAVAVDGGAGRLLALGRMPDAVIGDMDSLDPSDRARVPPDRLYPIAEQDSTDFDKALRSVRAPLIVAHGFLGKRLDHALAALGVLARRADRACILVGRHDVAALVPPHLSLAVEAGTRVSLFPMGPVTGRSKGLRWPIDGIGFAPDGIVGTSNAALGPVRLQMDAPAMVVILPAACRNALETGLRDAPAPWPVRAG